MFFTRDALEQASGERVAAACAARFAGCNLAADLGCGIGGDTIALARHADVLALDHDPLRLAIARANARACGVEGRVRLLRADYLDGDLPRLEAAFCDPGRRTERGRIFDVRRYDPPLPKVLELARSIPRLAIKVAPGIRDEDLPESCEAEFLQDGGDLKQGVLWLGKFATARRRATLLPEGATLTDAPADSVTVTEPAAVLYEPEPAVIRAHLVERLARALDATKLDERIAYLTADEVRPTPFATAYRVNEWMPFNLKRLRRRLQDLRVGRVVVKKRGSPLEPEELERTLALDGSEQRVLVLTRVNGRHAVLICSGPEGR
jgi:SAM-dependent methyltransferase